MKIEGFSLCAKVQKKSQKTKEKKAKINSTTLSYQESDIKYEKSVYYKRILQTCTKVSEFTQKFTQKFFQKNKRETDLLS